MQKRGNIRQHGNGGEDVVRISDPATVRFQRALAEHVIRGEGRFSWSSDRVLSTAEPDTEIELTKTLLLPRLGSWCGTPGFGDLEPQGRA